MLQNCEGVVDYDGEPNIETLVAFRRGDILISNIRPYLKKIWLADRDGGCNPDVLVIRITNESYLPEYVYGCLARQQFFDYVMTNVKGMKMPRGNKNHIMRYTIPKATLEEQRNIINEVAAYEIKIEEAKQIMGTAEQRKQAILHSYLS